MHQQLAFLIVVFVLLAGVVYLATRPFDPFKGPGPVVKTTSFTLPPMPSPAMDKQKAMGSGPTMMAGLTGAADGDLGVSHQPGGGGVTMQHASAVKGHPVQ
jgi:hypothetical protein